MKKHVTLAAVTERIRKRSLESRSAYLARIRIAHSESPQRTGLACGNLAHGFAACDEDAKAALSGKVRPNIAIVTAYNDMLSAHQPFAEYPALIKKAAWESGGVAQVAGGVPAMCDGVTQGQPGMELSLFSRDVIALSTAVALSHNMFDGVLCLGVCDKIVPGLLIGALSFGHLPVLFVPAGPMVSGLDNATKAATRKRYAEGEIGREELLASESRSYHSPGTCTFYGTANSNQLLMEFMGIHLPGASFVNPGTPLRAELTAAAAERVVSLAHSEEERAPLGEVVDERAVVNGIVGLLASGGSTNLTIHLVAIARAAGIHISWDDFDELSGVVPLLARVYPNGPADVNHFQAAGGVPLLIRMLLEAGLLHEDVATVSGQGLARYTEEPTLQGGTLSWKDGPVASLDPEVIGTVGRPFATSGGLRVLSGNLGRAIAKVSAVKEEHRIVEAPARVFQTQEGVIEAFQAGELDRDVVVVVQFQGPRANGMPELHRLTPQLSVLLDRGHQVALVTDGRMSGASGKVPAAIQLTPECLAGGSLARVEDGDLIRVDTVAGTLEVFVDAEALASRAGASPTASDHGFGRELFGNFRRLAGGAEAGASILDERPVNGPSFSAEAPSGELVK